MVQTRCHLFRRTLQTAIPSEATQKLLRKQKKVPKYSKKMVWLKLTWARSEQFTVKTQSEISTHTDDRIQNGQFLTINVMPYGKRMWQD
mmetsp:Transcript_6186/g.10587  ORF Transcript_6186/g.10587 Transcript_6186/m.10587 type:complete len:89 (+) Transcript_6186:956-1222(+)